MSSAVEVVAIALEDLEALIVERRELRKENADLKALILAAPSQPAALKEYTGQGPARSGVDTPITKRILPSDD